MNIQKLADRIAAACKKRGWSKDWSNGGCYLHLEVSEFIESLRGKGGIPEMEAADILITLLALIGENNVDGDFVETQLMAKIHGIEDGSVGVDVSYTT